MRHKLALIAGGTYDRQADRDPDAAAGARGRAGGQGRPELSPLEASDREDAALRLVRRPRHLAGGYEIAPTFVPAGMDVAWLDEVADDRSTRAALEGAVRWLNYTLETELLMNEIEDSTNRISNLVAAAKQYSQMDRAPFQLVDVHELLDSTLIMLSRKIGKDIQVVKDYDRSLPRDPGVRRRAQPGLDEPDRQRGTGDGRPRHADRSARVAIDDNAEVEIGDTGPGIPDDDRPASSSRSSPPSRSARAPGSAWTSRGGSWSTSTTATCPSSRCPATPGSAYGCRWLDQAPPGRRRVRPRTSPDRRGACAVTDNDLAIDPPSRRAAPAASSATRPAAGGCTCAGAPQCGHIGCCDTSPAQHATAHCRATGHRDHAELRAGRELVLELRDRRLLRRAAARRPAAATRSSRPTPGPRERVPADWRQHIH